MDARHLVRATNVAMVVVAGMAAGHLLMPSRATSGLAARAGFVATVLLAGALAGWRERREAVASGEAVRGPHVAWLAGGAAASALLAAAGWVAIH